MVLVNYATKEIVAKIVFYGPALCGKTTNLQYIYAKLNPKKRGKMISLATEADRTLFFDFLPMELGVVQGFRVRFQLYTVPGQVFYAATRRLVLKGADAIIFVADSQTDVLTKNTESIEDMMQNLMENSIDPYKIPIVLQYNKRDLTMIMDIDELDKKLNFRGAPSFGAVATQGVGVMDTFKEITRLLLQDLKKRHSIMDTEKMRDLPPEVFEYKEPPPVKPVEYEFELGSGYQDKNTEEEVVAGELLEQVEVISLADTMQAEEFFDNVRKGTTAEEAKEKARLARPPDTPVEPSVGPLPEPPAVAGAATDEEDGLLYELEDAGSMPDPVPPLRPSVSEMEAQAPPPPSAPSMADFLDMDMNSPEMMEPEGMAAAAHDTVEPGREAPPPEQEKGPVPPPAVQVVDLTPLILAISNMERRIGELSEEVSNIRNMAQERASVKPAAADVSGPLEELRRAFLATADGQDRLLLAILEMVRETKKGSFDSHEKIEDAVKYLIDRVRDEAKGTPRKKWF